MQIVFLSEATCVCLKEQLFYVYIALNQCFSTFLLQRETNAPTMVQVLALMVAGISCTVKVNFLICSVLLLTVGVHLQRILNAWSLFNDVLRIKIFADSSFL